MNKKNTALLLAALVASGCATGAKFQKKMNGFVGQDVEAVVRVYGVPNRIMELSEGRKIFEYTRGYTRTTPVQGHQDMYGNVTFTGGNRISHSCTVDFTVDQNQRVLYWSANGDHCVAH